MPATPSKRLNLPGKVQASSLRLRRANPLRYSCQWVRNGFASRFWSRRTRENSRRLASSFPVTVNG